MLRPETRARIEELLRVFPEKRSALLPALKLVQQDAGYLRREELEDLGDFFDVSPNTLFQLASFYSMLNLKPVGRFHFQLCDGLPCMLHGVEEMAVQAANRLGIQPGQTTADGMVTFARIECIGSCDRPCAALVNHLYLENLTPEKIDRLCERLLAGELPADLLRDPELAATGH